MKVIFYTATCFMDVSLEIINALKNFVELHVVIEITPKTLNQTVISIDNLPEDKIFADIESLVDAQNYAYLKPYLDGTASANFLIYKEKNFYSSLRAGYQLNKFIKEIKPDVLHLEALLIRSAYLLPSIFYFKKLFLSIHDPIPHIGENDIKINFIKSIYLNHPKLKGIFFYSKFAQDQFKNHYKSSNVPSSVIRMYPLNYLKNLAPAAAPVKKHILFFGRISPYKGIEVLLNAWPGVLKRFPKEHLVVAGRNINDYRIPADKLIDTSNTVSILNKHISNKQLVQLISEAKFVVCPYIEATQSGVLATSFALNTPVIASAVGAFTEYVDDNVNGCLIAPNDSEALTEKMVTLLERDFYVELSKNLQEENLKNGWRNNKSVLYGAYTNND